MISRRRGPVVSSNGNGHVPATAGAPPLRNGASHTTALRSQKTYAVVVLLGVALLAASSYIGRSDESLSLGDVVAMSNNNNRLLEIMSNKGAADNDNDNGSSIARLDISSLQALQQQQRLGSKEPVLLEGWTTMPVTKDWTKTALMQRVGHFPQYLKDSTVQLLKKNSQKEPCVVPGHVLASLLDQQENLLFFTNNQENEPFLKALETDYEVPPALQHITGFKVFSAMTQHQSHSFHRHGESWLGQVVGRRQWWFLPPSTSTEQPPPRVNACQYLTGEATLPPGATTILQEPGQIIWFPKDWYHATCALDEWTVGIGAQQGRTIRQAFAKLKTLEFTTEEQIQSTIQDCLGPQVAKEWTTTKTSSSATTKATTKTEVSKQPEKQQSAAAADQNPKDGQWKWFDGDLNAYYNSLEKDHKRDPTKLADYAVHRWLGKNKSTEEQYRLLDAAATQFVVPTDNDKIQVLDGGCGLGSALMWMEQHHATWNLTGYTVSEEQYKFIHEQLPAHNFQVHLKSYDELDSTSQYDFIYSIEALIHSPNATRTLEIWARHVKPGGIIAILDDFVVGGEPEKATEGMQAFAKSWLANSLFSVEDMKQIAVRNGMQVVQDRDLVQEYDIIGLNYRNTIPNIAPFGGRVHQGWMGSKWRQRLTVEGKLTYHLVVLQKPKAGAMEQQSRRQMTTTTPISVTDDSETATSSTCAHIPLKQPNQVAATFTEITPQLMSGRGKNGGDRIACISGWYCCNKGTEWWDKLDKERTDNTAFLKLDRSLFGHYIDSFAKHLNQHYAKYPSSASSGRFLDIGGTGSTASGMTQVTSKFQHFAGPLEYWKLDSDPAAKDLERTLYCNIEDCPMADTCGFDVTFSHTVLEHASHPWLAFDTIARITKQGGLTMHLVPFSYQYHATPDDNYRFSHKALISLLEDRGFEVLEVGYDICTKPDNMLRRVDEHYDTIWLTYVIARKL